MAKTQQDVLRSFMASLDKTTLSGATAIEEAVKACSKFKGISELITKMVEDCKKAGSAETFLKDYCGIDLGNSDTGAITGKDAGGSKVKTAESIVPENGGWQTFTGNSFTKNGVTFNLVTYADRDGNDYYARSYDSLSDVQKIMWNGLYSWWGSESTNLIAQSYGSNFGFTSSSSATTKTINFGFIENEGGTLAWTRTYSNDGYKTASGLGFAINMDYYSNLSSTNKNGYDASSGQGYLDRTLAHEFTHAVMSANIDYFSYLPMVIVEGMAEVTHGIDDERMEGILTLAGDSELVQESLQLSSNYNNSTIWAADYCAGYMLLRYLAHQTAQGNDNAGSFLTSGKDFYLNHYPSTIVSALAGNDTVYNYAEYATVNGGAGKDIIYNKQTSSFAYINGGADNDYIQTAGYMTTVEGGAGNDTVVISDNLTIEDYGAVQYNYIGYNHASISGGAGNDVVSVGGSYLYDQTINGGKGNDTIYSSIFLDSFCEDCGNIYQYEKGDGNDIIIGYKDNDAVSIAGGTYTTSTVGNDVLIKVGDGTVSLVGAKGKTIKITGQKKFTNGNDQYTNYTEDTVISALGGNDTIFNYADYVTINGDAGNDKIYNYAISFSSIGGGTGNDYIELNELNDHYIPYGNTIDGGAGDDTINYDGLGSSINGGSGNDKITVQSTYYYNTVSGGAGDDTIFLENVSYNDYCGNVYEYAKGEGNDVIYGYTSNDTLKIIGGNYTKSTVGNNILIKVGSGTITLVGASGKTINIADNFAASENIADNPVIDYSAEKSQYDSAPNPVHRVFVNKNPELPNGDKQTILVENKNNPSLWFAEENDFLTKETPDLIVQNNAISPLGQIEIPNFDNLAEEEKYKVDITYSYK